MRNSRFSEEQIIKILKEKEAGDSGADDSRERRRTCPGNVNFALTILIVLEGDGEALHLYGG